MGGGVLFAYSPYSKQAFYPATLQSPALSLAVPAFVCFLLLEFSYSMSPALLESSSTPQGQKGIETGQKGAKVNKFLVCFGVFSGKSETKNGKNKEIFYFWGFRGAAFILFYGGGGRVHWWQVVQGAGAFVVLSWCVPSLSPCLLSLCCVCFPASALKYALFRVLRAFLEGFAVRMYICMGLVLCVACVGFVRVWS